MTSVLPIKAIRDEDAPLTGVALATLAKLSQLGFSVEEGVAVLPPEFHLKTILKHYNLKNSEIFEQSLVVLKKEILNIPVPAEIIEYFKKKDLNPKKIWLQLLEVWIEDIRQRIWSGGLSKGLTLGLPAQPVFVSDSIKSSGKAYFDELEGKVVIDLEKGGLKEVLREEIEKMVISANKKLLIPQVYHWIITGSKFNVKIVKVTPYTPPAPKSSEQSLLDDILTPKKENSFKEDRFSTSVKVFMEMGSNFVFTKNADGIFISGVERDTDVKMLQIIEAAQAYPQGSVFYKLEDQIEQVGGVRGTLNLNHQESLLRRESQIFLFARNKKRLLNVELVIPFVRSANEFLQLKRNLAALGIMRKGTLKIWMEAAVPENIINIEDYIDAGIDGVVFNLDELSSWIGGFDLSLGESAFYKKQITALVKFLEDALKTLHKVGVKAIFKGELSLDDEFLRIAVSKGVYGLIANYTNADSLHEQINFYEKRHVRANS